VKLVSLRRRGRARLNDLRGHLHTPCCVVCLQALAKKLVGGSGVISSMAIHPSGDHVILGSEDKRLAW
jgi:hypothetical protein